MPDRLLKYASAAGEVSPAVYSRIDIESHPKALKTCRNMIPLAQGEAENRSGTYFAGEVEDSDRITRLVTFTFSTTQSYALEFGHNVFRIWFNGALAEDPPSIPVEVVTTYTEDELADLKFTQSADVLYVAHPDHVPRKITRTSHIAWSITDVFFKDGPYRVVEDGDEDIRFDIGPRSGLNISLTSSSAYFTSEMVGAYFRLGHINPLDFTEVYWGWGIIISYVSSTEVKVDTIELMGYESIKNSDFLQGLDFWEDKSVTDSSILYDMANSNIDFLTQATGSVSLQQAFPTLSGERYDLEVVTSLIDGTLRVSVGTTVGGSEIYGPFDVTVAGIVNFAFVSTQQTLYLTLEDTGSVNGDVSTIDSVRVSKLDRGSNLWRIGEWFTDDDNPSVISFFESRLWLGATHNKPQTLWGSKIGDFEKHSVSTPISDTDAVSYAVDSQEVNALQWMKDVSGIMIAGASDGIWTIDGAGGGPITPTSIDIKKQIGTGSSGVEALVIDRGILFLNKGQNAVKEVAYALEADGFEVEDKSILAEHLFKDYTITEWAYTQHPVPAIWCIRDDGILLGMTYQKKEGVWAWHRHDTEGKYKSITVVTEGATDVIYVVVERQINSSTVQYVEYFMPRINDEESDDYFFVDSGLSKDVPITITGISNEAVSVVTAPAHGLSGDDLIRITNVKGMTEINRQYYTVWSTTADTFKLKDVTGVTIVDTSEYGVYTEGGVAREATSTISGLAHLEGENITILADGALITDKTVSSGEVTLDYPAALIHAGLSYVSDYETLDLEGSPQGGITQGRLKNVISADVYFHNSRGAKVGVDEDHLDEIPFLDEADGGRPPLLYTGTKNISVDSNYDKQKTLFIRQEYPFPMSITAVVSKVQFSEI